MYYTVHVQTESSVCSRGKNWLAVTHHRQNCSYSSEWISFPWRNSSADLKLLVSRMNLFLWIVLDYCLLREIVVDLLTGVDCATTSD